MASNFYKAGAAAMTSNKGPLGDPAILVRPPGRGIPLHSRCRLKRPERKMRTPLHSRKQWPRTLMGGRERVFCNPPYGRNIGDWIRKASQEASKPDTLVVLLVPARTDTRWFQNHILHRAEVRFLPGRLNNCGRNPLP